MLNRYTQNQKYGLYAFVAGAWWCVLSATALSAKASPRAAKSVTNRAMPDRRPAPSTAFA